MVQHHTFFGKLFGWIGDIFSHVFEGAKKTYESLTPEQQAALLHGSGIIDILNTEVGKTPAEIRALIIQRFPDLDEAKLEAGLIATAHAFNLAVDINSIEDVIAQLQAYLSSLHGNIWESISHGVAGLLAVLFSPSDTKFAAIGSLVEYVYQTFFKKHNV